jgi:excinuclease ABC subunit C
VPAEIDLAQIPEEPGVYLFRDAEGDVLYVGKAADLRARLAQYRQPQEDIRKASMVERAAAVDFVLTATEKEALLLEASLVRRHKPRYNVRLTDDKRYPYLRLSAGEWPRISISRDTRDPESTYFGPFPDAGAARQTLEVVRQVFRMRNCRELIPGGCLAFQMRLCWAPCVTDANRRKMAVGTGELAAAHVPSAYRTAAAEARRFLRGEVAPVTSRLTEEMEQAAKREDFEYAAHVRDRIVAVRNTVERQAVFGSAKEDRDVFAVAREGPLAVGVVVLIRMGAVAGQEQYTFRSVPAESTDAELCEEFVRRYYENLPTVPAEVVVASLPPEPTAVEEWLSDRRRAPVRLRAAGRGDLARTLALAERNARFHLSQMRLRRGDADITAEALDLAARLGLSTPPRRIECVDISHLGGTGVVASLAVLVDGRAARAQYRRFRIKMDRNDDPAAIHEAVGRRLRHPEWPRPDLLLIDGGTTQLAAAARARAESAVGVPLAALAKREEEVFAPGPGGFPRKVPFPRDAPGLAALQRVRDEAHRFALGYQRKVRRRSLAEGKLDVPGIGAARKRALLTHFGSVDAVVAASAEELARVPGIGPSTAKRIHAVFHGT